jgi:hypothetical protein
MIIIRYKETFKKIDEFSLFQLGLSTLVNVLNSQLRKVFASIRQNTVKIINYN